MTQDLAHTAIAPVADKPSAPTVSDATRPALTAVPNTLQSLEQKFADYFGKVLPTDILPQGTKVNLKASIYEGKESLHLDFIAPDFGTRLLDFDKAVKAALNKLDPIGGRVGANPELEEALRIKSDKPVNDNRFLFSLELSNVSLTALSNELHAALVTPEAQRFEATGEKVLKPTEERHTCTGPECTQCGTKSLAKEEAEKVVKDSAPSPATIEASMLAPLPSPEPEKKPTAAANDNVIASHEGETPQQAATHPPAVPQSQPPKAANANDIVHEGRIADQPAKALGA